MRPMKITVGEKHPLRERQGLCMADLAPYRYVTNKNLDEDLVYQKLKEIGYANEVIQVNDVITRSVVVSMNAMNVVMDLGLQAGNQQYQEQLYPLDIQDFQGAYAKEEFVDYFICDDFYHSANAVENVFLTSCFFNKTGSLCDVMVVSAVGIILCLLFKVGKEVDVIHKVPFSIIIMICSMGMLINIAINGGLVELLSDWITANINSSTFAPYMLTLTASSIISFFAATLGVVIPTLSLLMPSLVTMTGLISNFVIYTSCSPFSTCGAMALAGLDEDKERDKLFKKLLILPIICAVICGSVWRWVFSEYGFIKEKTLQ